jgi:nicotinamidase-related amidase
VQNDFCKGGSLEVTYANSIIPLINRLKELLTFDVVVLIGAGTPRIIAHLRQITQALRFLR